LSECVEGASVSSATRICAPVIDVKQVRGMTRVL